MDHYHIAVFDIGKSHLAEAIGHEAALKNIDVLYRNTYELFKWLHSGRADGSFDRRIAQIKTVPLWTGLSIGQSRS